MSNYLVTTARGTVRVHRETCKKAKNTITLADLGGARVEEALPASCCKPSAKGVEEAVTARLAELEEPATEEATVELLGPDPEVAEELTTVYTDAKGTSVAPAKAKPIDPSVEPDEDNPYKAVDIAFTESGVAKHYWKVFCKEAALAMGLRYGAGVRANANGARITGPTDQVDQTVEALRSLWVEGYAAFNTWRKTDEQYKAIKAADNGHHWFKSGRAQAELDWMADYVDNS